MNAQTLTTRFLEIGDGRIAYDDTAELGTVESGTVVSGAGELGAGNGVCTASKCSGKCGGTFCC